MAAALAPHHVAGRRGSSHERRKLLRLPLLCSAGPTLAVGTIDGEGVRAMSAIASRLTSTNAAVRRKVIHTSTAREAASDSAVGKVDLAVVRRRRRRPVERANRPDLQPRRADHRPARFVDRRRQAEGTYRRGDRQGAGPRVVDVLTGQYDLARAKVTFKDVPLQDERRVVELKEVSALLVVTADAEIPDDRAGLVSAGTETCRGC